MTSKYIRPLALLLCAALLVDIRAPSAHCSSDAAAMTDFKEQPDTPGPQPRQGAKAFSVPVMENTEFSSKLPGFSSPVLASVVEEGMKNWQALQSVLDDIVPETNGEA